MIKTFESERVKEYTSSRGLKKNNGERDMGKIDEVRLGFETAYIDGSVVSNNIYRPEFVFLDEATSALDEDLEGNLYDMLKIHLPNTKIISIAHRSSLIAKHQAILRLKEKGCWEIHE